MHSLLKDVLFENVNNEDFYYDPYHFFKHYNQPKSYFEDSAVDELKLFLMHEFHKHKNLGSLHEDNLMISKLLYNIPTNLSLKQFEMEIQKLDMISLDKTDKRLTLGRLVRVIFANKVIGNGGWLKMYSNKIKGASVSEFTHRIYLAVDNSCLHKFALLLVKLCDLFHMAYQFKINNGNGGNSYDNVVIYANEKELLTYINCILYILYEYPEIKMNQQCLLAYPFDQNIAIAPYLDTKHESYSQIVSKRIKYYRENAENRLEFITNVEAYLNDILAPVATLCEQVSQKKITYQIPCVSQTFNRNFLVA